MAEYPESLPPNFWSLTSHVCNDAHAGAPTDILQQKCAFMDSVLRLPPAGAAQLKGMEYVILEALHYAYHSDRDCLCRAVKLIRRGIWTVPPLKGETHSSCAVTFLGKALERTPDATHYFTAYEWLNYTGQATTGIILTALRRASSSASWFPLNVPTGARICRSCL